jgi:hypothetical protein
MEGIDKTTFKQIFREHWGQFKQAYPRYDGPEYDQVIQKMLDCGDPEKMGFVQYRCCSCGESRRIAFTCKSCFCLSCAKVYADRWADFIGRRLIPQVTYRHEVFTVPDFLRGYFYRNPDLLNCLMQTGNNCLLDILQTCTRTSLTIGTMIVLQTSGRSGRYNPHLHILFTAGGVDPQGRWKPVSYIPYELLHRKWQYHLLTMLAQEVDPPTIQAQIDHGWKDYPQGFVAFLQKGDVPAGGKGLAEYLAKYVTSPPISVRRIERYDGQTVSYWYRDHKTETIQHETVPVLTFIGRMVQHILPKGFQRIRYYGLHANACYARNREALAALLKTRTPPADPRGFRVLPRSPFAQRFEKSFGKDPLTCPKCGDTMQLELIYHPRYGILKEFRLFTEIPHDEPFTKPTRPGGRAVDRTQRMVQIPLPFL